MTERLLLFDVDSDGNPTYDPQTGLPIVTLAGNPTKYEYDNRGRKTREIYPDNTPLDDTDNPVTTYGYAAPTGCSCSGSQGSEPSRITDPEGNLTERGYDKLGRLRMVTQYIADDANGIPKYETYYGYDAAGNLTTITDGNGHTTTFAYDALNRLVQQIQPPRTSQGETSGRTEIYAWNPDGTLDYKIDRMGRTLQYNFDRINRIYRIDYPDGTTKTITYDKLNRIMDAVNSAVTLHYEYNELGRIKLYRQGTKEFTFTYDMAGNRKTLTDPQTRTLTYTYDPENRISTITDPVAGTITQTYDALGRPATRTFPNAMITDYGYDVRNRLQTLTHKANGGSILSDRTYTYDNANNVTDIAGTQTKHYDYDDLYRLTNATQEGESFTYDPVGNRLTYNAGTPWTFNENNQLKTAEGINYSYDDNGNRISKSDGTTYLYDYENRLTEVKVNGATIATYQYDPLNRRISKTVSGAVTEFLYLPEGLYAEYDGTGTETKRYLYNPQTTFMTDPLAMIQNGNAYYYHNDHLGTPQLMTDSTQTVVWQADYTAFGKATITTGTITNNLRYPGQYYDAETGLHYNWNRYYDPEVGRYLSVDPVGLRGGMNLYRYVSNNPVISIDPLGLYLTPNQQIIISIVSGVGAAVGGIIGGGPVGSAVGGSIVASVATEIMPCSTWQDVANNSITAFMSGFIGGALGAGLEGTTMSGMQAAVTTGVVAGMIDTLMMGADPIIR